MKKFEERKIEKTENICVDIICNKCGKQCIGVNASNGERLSSSISINYTWGYWSNKDMVKQSADICESCWDEFVKTFVVPIEEIIDEDVW